MNNNPIYNSFLMQRRQLSQFSTPPERFSLISPYPTYTQEQLNMRRKAEILKYENTTQSTKTNNLTKKQQFALLVNGNTQNLSQYEIKYNSMTTKYTDMSTQASISSNSDIPGTPVLLRLDPTIPLYNHISKRNYVDITTVNNIKYDLFTTNTLSFLIKNEYDDIEDTSNQYNKQTRSCPLGVIKFLGNPLNNYTSFNISSPIALWVNFIYGCGVRDINDTIIKNPGDISNNNIYLNVTDVSLNILYNGNSIALSPETKINKSFQSIVIQGSSIEIGQNYGVQYIGMLEINNLIIPSYMNSIYDVTVDIKYSCNIGHENDINNNFDNTIFDFFKTGVFSNIVVDESNYSSGFKFESSIPDYNPGSFIHY